MTLGKNGPAPGWQDLDILKQLTSGFNYEKENLWNACVFLHKKYEIDVNAGGYSVIGSQDDNSDFYGRVCLKVDIQIYTRKDFADGTKPFYSVRNSASWGNVLIFSNRY